MVHIVQPGECLYFISLKYRVNINKIIQMNGLEEIPHLIPGQALIIPTSPSHTLWDKVCTTKHKLEVNGYIIPMKKNAEIINNVGKQLTYISPFSYQVKLDGTLIPLNDENILKNAKERKIKPLLVITNLKDGNFDANLVHHILTNESVQQDLIKNLLNILNSQGYYGLNIDFERIPAQDRQLYNDFVKKVTDALHAKNYPISVALAPKPYDIQTGEWHGAHDYQTLGQIVDYVVLMTYDWGWSGGVPMAIAPINEVKKVLDYATSVISPDKLLMGIPLYGYDWTLPYKPGGKLAKSISHLEALKIASKHCAYIRYDQTAESPYFYYTVKTNTRKIDHVVWFEDVRSLFVKFKLVNQYGLRGISYWSLNLLSPQNWVLLECLFRVEKN